MSEKIDFSTLNMQIPEYITKTYSPEKQLEIFNYLSSLDDHQKKAYEIAFDHLGTSFSIMRSNGFKEWKQKSL
jgi:hypothetical protein